MPGDLVEIIDDLSIPCDLVLISGESVVNESMLTGIFYEIELVLILF